MLRLESSEKKDYTGHAWGLTRAWQTNADAIGTERPSTLVGP